MSDNNGPEMRKKVVALLTCHNRKDKTLACLEHMVTAKNASTYPMDLDVILTDDGSSDGTSEAVKSSFPEVNILEGTGSLYWAGGMRNSWREALRKGYDGYLLINDDTLVSQDCFEQIWDTHEYSMLRYSHPGIYVGSVQNPGTGEFSYGGRNMLNKWTFAMEKIIPNGKVQTCELGNANIMFVHSEVQKSVGILSEKYVHGKADFDYTLRAREQGLPVLVCPAYCGSCEFDKEIPSMRKLNLKERFDYLKSPLGIEIKGYLYFMRRFYPLRYPFVAVSLFLKALLPGIMLPISKAVR